LDKDLKSNKYNHTYSVIHIGLLYLNGRKTKIHQKESNSHHGANIKHTNARRIFILDRRGPDRVVVGFTATCAISAYDH
jgi:hypothetical protein